MAPLSVSEVRFDGPICSVTIPGGLWDEAVVRDLMVLADRLLEDRQVRVISLAAHNRDFCRGLQPGLRGISPEPNPASAWARLRVPIVVAVDGLCRSAGLEFVLATDILIASPAARFALDDLTADGQLPCWGGTQRLPRAIRQAEATAMILLGTELTADRAASLGLVHLVTGDDQTVDDLAQSVTAQLARNGPLALELTKEAVHRGAELPLRDALRLEGDLNHQLAATDDRAEGLAAFFAKRPPDFAGR